MEVTLSQLAATPDRPGQSWLGTGPAQATIGCDPGVPLPSRLPVASGRSTGDPLAAAARAGAVPGPGEDQRVLALEEPVAAHPARWPAPWRGTPGRASPSPRPARCRAGPSDEPLAVTTTDDAGSSAPNHTTEWPVPSLMPAMPPPDCALRSYAGGGEVQQLSVGADEAELLVTGAQLDRADDLVAVLEPDHLPLVPAEHLGVHPLHDAVLGAQRQSRPVGAERRTARGPAHRAGASAPGRTAVRPGGSGGWPSQGAPAGRGPGGGRRGRAR